MRNDIKKPLRFWLVRDVSHQNDVICHFVLHCAQKLDFQIQVKATWVLSTKKYEKCGAQSALPPPSLSSEVCKVNQQYCRRHRCRLLLCAACQKLFSRSAAQTLGSCVFPTARRHFAQIFLTAGIPHSLLLITSLPFCSTQWKISFETNVIKTL